MTVIALDAMGGDHAPQVPVRAAVRFARQTGTTVLLVGDEGRLRQELARQSSGVELVQVHHSTQQIEMDEAPTALLRGKRGSSLRAAFELVASGQAQAVVSAGHSGAMMVAGKAVLGTLSGIDRPAIATPLPLRSGALVLIDSGANVDCKARYLLQFAHMGQAYARLMLQAAAPRVGLLSIGTEPGKGNALVREAYPLLEQGCASFVGNVEPRDLFRGRVDVAVCDGFVGNLVLKTAEASSRQTRLLLHHSVGDVPWGRLLRWMAGGVFRRLARHTEPREVGGSLLMGLQGVVIVCHGASTVGALVNGMQAALLAAQANLVGTLTAEFEQRHGARPVSA